MGRGLFFGFFLLVGGSSLILWLALWFGLSTVEREVLNQAKYLNFPVMVDSLSRPLDTVLERRLQDSLYLSERRLMAEWLIYAHAERYHDALPLQNFLEAAIAHYEFPYAFFALGGHGGFWSYEDGHLYKNSNENIIPPRYSQFYRYPLKNRSYQVEFVSSEIGDTLWFIIPIGENGKDLVGFGVDTAKVMAEMQQVEAARGHFLFPDGYSLLQNNDIHLFIVDNSGRIILSDQKDRLNQNIYAFLPVEIQNNFLGHIAQLDRPAHSHTIHDEHNGVVEFIHYPLMSGAMEVIITIPHEYVNGFINKIRNYTVLFGVISLLTLVCAMFAIYRYVIDPASRVRRINRELASVVKERTESLEKVVNFDSLTGVYNRRYFDYSLRLTYARCLVEKQPLTILFLDVDFFKKYNDSCGHLAGDQCLQRVAGILKHGCHRSHDLVARYGGEEFVVLLPETEADGGLIIAERLRASVEQAGIPHPSSDVAAVITVSIGLLSLVPNEETSPRQMLEQADDALYRAKKGGRNRVYKADSELI